MRETILTALFAVALTGCATQKNRETVTEAGTPVYDFERIPQSSVTGVGTLMPGAYSSHVAPTGQFTGQERTHDDVGQRPTPSREGNPLLLERDARITDSRTTLGTGAGSLGQSGIAPSGTEGAPGLPIDPRLTQPSANEIIRSGEQQPLPSTAVGAPAGAETGSVTNIPPKTAQ